MFSIRTCIIVIVISAEETATHSSTRSSSSLQRRTVILHSRRSSPVILQKQFLLHRENDSYDSHSVRTRESFHPCEFLSSKRSLSLLFDRSYLMYRRTGSRGEKSREAQNSSPQRSRILLRIGSKISVLLLEKINVTLRSDYYR